MGSIARTAGKVAERGRSELATRLEGRRAEIEQAVLTRVHAISGPAEALDPQYAEGLRAAIGAAVDYGLAAIEAAEAHSPPLPPVLLAQARLAARSGVSLDTVLRRYFAGYALLCDYLVEEAEGSDLGGAGLQRLLRIQATLFDHLLEAVSQEHAREIEERPASREQRRAERIERLLAGELVETSALGYDFEGHHLGVLTSGPEVRPALRELAAQLDCRLLALARPAATTWAWLGSRRRLDPAELARRTAAAWPAKAVLAIGEPGSGLAGWRLTHRQAKAALPIAARRAEPVIRYAEVSLLASVLRDDLLLDSLRQLYLQPLESEGEGEDVARETLRAYFAAERNASAAAAMLGLSRQTVNNRLRVLEGRLNRTIGSCATELELALAMEELEYLVAPSSELSPIASKLSPV